MTDSALTVVAPERTKDPRYRGLKPWPKGVSGNPGGRTPLQAECTRIARDMCPEALRRAGEIMRQNDDQRAALVAIGIVLDRGLGKPKEQSEDLQQRPKCDFSKLTSDELSTLRNSLAKILSIP